MKSFFKIKYVTVMLFVVTVFFNMSFAAKFCPNYSANFDWNTWSASRCASSLLTPYKSKVISKTNQQPSGTTNTSKITSNNDTGQYSLHCDNQGVQSINPGVDYIEPQSLPICYNEGNKSIQRVDYCVNFSNNGGNTYVIGYMWSEYSVPNDPEWPKEWYQVTPVTQCNPCNTNAQETWNGLSGTSVQCYPKPVANIYTDFNNNKKVTISCKNSNSYILKDDNNKEIYNNTNNPNTNISDFTTGFDINNARTYTLTCHRNKTPQDNKNTSSLPVSITFTKLSSNFPDSLNNKTTGSIKTETYPTLTTTCPTGYTSTGIYRSKDNTLVKNNIDDTVILNNDIQPISYYTNCTKPTGDSIGLVSLEVYYPYKISVTPTPLRLQTEANKDITLSWTSNSDSCSILDYKDTVLIDNILPDTIGGEIAGVSPYIISNNKYIKKVTPTTSGFEAIAKVRTDNDILGYKIKCKDTYKSRRENTESFTIETYNKTKATIDTNNGVFNMTCTPSYNYIFVQKKLSTSNTWEDVFKKDFGNNQSSVYLHTLTSTANYDYRLTCQSLNIPNNISVAEYNSADGKTKDNTPDTSNNTGKDTNKEIVIIARCNPAKSQGCYTLIDNKTDNACTATINSVNPNVIKSNTYEKYTLDLNQNEWIVKCDNISTYLKNPFKQNIKVNKFEITPTELPCSGGKVKISYDIGDINGGECTLPTSDFNGLDTITINGSGVKEYPNIITTKRIELKCKKDGLTPVTYSRYATVTCRGER